MMGIMVTVMAEVQLAQWSQAGVALEDLRQFQTAAKKYVEME
jgi:hypothetical protein